MTNPAWRDISTAPKDGTGVLLWIAAWETALVAWFADGQWWTPVRRDSRMGVGTAPTLWAPLPAPPSRTEAE